MNTLDLIKELRKQTGAGFSDCQKALKATENDLKKATVWLEEKGAAKAKKKIGAIAVEGVVNIAHKNNIAVIYEINSQTDFVARNEQFLKLVDSIGKALVENDFDNLEKAKQILVNKKSIADLCIEATATIGEKIELRRAKKVNINDKDHHIGKYVHFNKQIAAIVIINGATEEIAKNVAMHVASMNPRFLDEKQVPKNILDKFNKEILESPTLKNKPEKIIANIAKGMLRKKLSDITLVDQEFVMEKMSVLKYLANHKAKACDFIRFEVAEGLEKKANDFAAEVAKQMKK